MKAASSVEEIEDEWGIFATHVEKIWVKTERASQAFRNKFQPWQGKYARIRKKDPLLRYVKHARNADQHSIQRQVDAAATERRHEPAFGNSWFIEHLEIKNGEVVAYAGDKPLKITDLPNRVELQRVKDGSKTYNPPREHRGTKLIWSSPVMVAQLALTWYKEFVDETEKQFFETHA